MARSIPVVPVSGTVITVAWATSSVVDPINWLYVLTGGADPPAANRMVRSTSTTATIWGQVIADCIGDAQITDIKMALQKVNRSNTIVSNFTAAAIAQLTDFFQVQNPTDTKPNANTDFYMLQIRHTNVGVDFRWQLAVDISNQNEIYCRNIINSGVGAWVKLWHAGNDGAGSGLDAGLFGGQLPAFYATASSVSAIVQVPLNAVVWFPTLADLTAAGASWTRHTAADGRLLVGAGTAGSPSLSNPQTFAEATNYGTDWGHTHGAGSYATSGGFTGTAADAVTVQSGGGAQASAITHQNSLAALPVGGTSTATVWLPGMRAGVYGRRI